MIVDQRTPAENVLILRAVRFALVCVLLGLSYFTVRVTLKISAFQPVFADLLEGTSLPILTSWVLQGRSLLCILSILLPLAAFATLFTRVSGKSFYLLGFIALMILFQLAIVCHALTEPLLQLFDQLGAASN